MLRCLQFVAWWNDYFSCDKSSIKVCRAPNLCRKVYFALAGCEEIDDLSLASFNVV